MLSRYSHLKYSRELDLPDKILLSHTLVHRTSFQALRFHNQDRPLAVLVTEDEEWFIGAIIDYGSDQLPVVDSEYFSSEEAAREALANQSWTQRLDR